MKSVYTGIGGGASVEKGKELFGSEPIQNEKWDESKHPRAEDGKFGSGGGSSGGGSKSESGGESSKGGSNVTPIKKPLTKDAWFDTVKGTQPYMWDRKGPGELVMFFKDKKAGGDAAAKLKALGGKTSAIKHDSQSGKYVMTVKEPEFTGESKDEQDRLKKEKTDRKAALKRESSPDQKDFDRMDRENDPDKRSKASQKAERLKEKSAAREKALPGLIKQLKPEDKKVAAEMTKGMMKLSITEQKKVVAKINRFIDETLASYKKD